MFGPPSEYDLSDLRSALKKSRGFLASAPESLPHWAAHARLERLRGRLDEARKVYQTVLSSPTSTGSRLSTGPLWWDWAEMEWLAGDPDAATRVVLRAADVEGLGLAILRGKRALEATAQEIPETLWKVRETWTRLGVLLELLTGHSLPSLMTAPLEAGTVVQESMAIASLGMLYHHISTLKSPTRPVVLRERLETAVELFPDNTILLGMFLEMQRGQGLWGRVRKLGDINNFGDVAYEKGVSRCAAEIWLGGWEKGRWFWEVERIRGSLTAAIENERCVYPGMMRITDSKPFLSPAHEGALSYGDYYWSWRYGQVIWRGQKMCYYRLSERVRWLKVRVYSHK